MTHIVVSLTDGRTVRDLFENEFLDVLQKRGCTVAVLTEAATVPEFVREWTRPGVTIERLLPSGSTTARNRAYFARRRAVRLGRAALRAFLAAERRALYPPRKEYLELFSRQRPDLVFGTHAQIYAEQEVLATARSMGIPTLGFVRSWDNVHKGIKSRPDEVAVWNEVNQREVIELEGYAPENVHVVGPPPFDRYFAPGAGGSREELARAFGLDPTRPIILFATLGYFIPGLDETCWMDSLVKFLDEGRLPGRPQIVCRLHPWSRYEHFAKYAKHPDVRLSFVDRYVPTLTWTMTRGDVDRIAAMLKHADVVITPGSTMTIEGAIFDRPTIMPVYHLYQPEMSKDYFDTWSFGMHYGRIAEAGLIPMPRSEAEFEADLREALADPGRHAEARRRLVAEYVGPTDGGSTRRLAHLVADKAGAPR